VSRGWIRTRVGDFHLDVEWSVAPGEVLVVYGPSGAGKTLTLRAITGLLRPQAGHVEVGDTVVHDGDSGRWVPPHRRGIGYVPQHYGLFPHLTAAQNIGYGLHRWPRERLQSRVGALLDSFRLTRLADQRPHRLSGGEQQRVALARAVAPEPRLLLLDEPFSALDAEIRRSLRTELRTLLASWDIPIILVTHDREEALALGHRLQVMDSGRVVDEGEPLQLLGQPPSATLARLVGVENLYQGRVLSRSAQNGTMLCEVEGVTLELPLADLPEGATVTIGVRARDVLLATRRPQGLSARNLLPGRILSLETRSPGVEVAVECGITVRSQVTQEAVRELSLRPGTRIWVVLKASSCFLVAREARSP